ncbi:hypothetical protein [Chelatococcus reniformis]|uniref:Oxidoreductase n=1 Tax=Chelatococcus reniformis TaxID=1494448 RepID=A0A916UFU1_9HYPH|nr:hypothetical protein [Chelatococcus reniformis]GGC70709.1 hypothetical protein GCM10010994_31570 [Chelatococcus reniformis]
MKKFAIPFAAALVIGGSTIAFAQSPGSSGTMGGSANSPTSNPPGMSNQQQGIGSSVRSDSSTGGPNSASDPAKTDATGSIKGGPNRNTGGNPGGDGSGSGK